MKSFAELKRNIRVGTRLELVSAPAWLNYDLPEISTVAVVQTNAIAFAGNERSRGKLRWLYWPKTSKLIGLTDDGFSFCGSEDAEPLVYRFA